MSFEFSPADEDPHGECRHHIQEQAAKIRDLESENDRLRSELAEHLETILHSEGRLIPEGKPRAGWWDTCASTDAVCAGSHLVELGLYEEAPDGYGRRQFYRKLDERQRKDGE